MLKTIISSCVDVVVPMELLLVLNSIPNCKNLQFFPFVPNSSKLILGYTGLTTTCEPEPCGNHPLLVTFHYDCPPTSFSALCIPGINIYQYNTIFFQAINLKLLDQLINLADVIQQSWYQQEMFYAVRYYIINAHLFMSRTRENIIHFYF